MALHWNGTGFVMGVPAKDLTDQEVEWYGGEEYLLSLGIYEKVDNKPKERPSADRRSRLPEETK